MHADHWTHFATIYHRAILADRILPMDPNYVVGTKQKTIRSFFPKGGTETLQQSRVNLISHKLACIERDLRAKEAAFTGDISFSSIYKRKESRNSIGEVFRGIGRAKIRIMQERGVHTAKELLAYDGGDPAIKESWKCIV